MYGHVKKRCARCGKRKEGRYFTPRKNAADGLYRICKQCQHGEGEPTTQVQKANEVLKAVRSGSAPRTPAALVGVTNGLRAWVQRLADAGTKITDIEYQGDRLLVTYQRTEEVKLT